LKNLVLFLILNIVYSISFCQPKLINQRCIGFHQQEYYRDAILSDDGNFWVTMFVRDTVPEFVDNPFTGISALLMKMDTNLNIISKHYFGGNNGVSAFTKIRIALDKSIWCVGYTYATDSDCIGGSGNDIFVVKTDAQGNKKWSRCYAAYNSPVSSVLPTNDGGAIISFINSGGPTNFIPYHYGSTMSVDAGIFRIDSLGNVKWVRILGGTAGDAIFGDLLWMDSTHFRADLWVYSDDYDLAGSFGNSDTLKHWLILMDTAGVITKQVINRGYQYFVNDNPISQLAIDSGRVLLVGRGIATNPYATTAPLHQADEGLVAIYDKALNLIQMKQWGGTGKEVFFSYCRDQSGNYYFGGNTSSKNNGDISSPLHGNDDFWIIKTDWAFNLIWSRTFGGSSTSGEAINISKMLLINDKIYFWAFNYINQLPDGDFNCGHKSNFTIQPTSDAWVGVFDLNTTTGIPTITTSSFANNMYEIHPNPSSNFITIISKTKHSKQSSISISSINGKIVLKEKWEEQLEKEIAVNQLPNGIYILHIDNKTTSPFDTKLIIQH